MPTTLLRLARRLAGLAVFVAAPVFAQPSGSWQVHNGPDAPHSFGTTVGNGESATFLSGAEIPPASDPAWTSTSSDLSVRWTGGQSVSCRAAADYSYLQTAMFPTAGDRYVFSFNNVDDAARVTVYNERNPGGVEVPNSVVNLRESKRVDVTPALMPGATNRVVITVANVCGPSSTVHLDVEVEEGEAAGMPLTSAHSFARGERLYNSGGDHFLTLNPDGNLVVARADGGYVWGFDTQSSVDHTRVGRVDWQPDGNLAAYDANGGYLWSALTENPDPASRLELTASGALQIVSPSRGVLWSSAGAAASEETMTIGGTEVRTGDVQVTLEWDTRTADLDLFVTDPSGARVGYDNPRVASGGILDVDAQAGCQNTDSTVENIIWEGTPPSGTFVVLVDHYQQCTGSGPVSYTATLRRGGQVVETWTGSVGLEGEDTYTFTTD